LNDIVVFILIRHLFRDIFTAIDFYVQTDIFILVFNNKISERMYVNNKKKQIAKNNTILVLCKKKCAVKYLFHLNPDNIYITFKYQ